MAEIPSVTLTDLANWFRMKAELGRLKGQEAMLRTRIFKHFFPVPTEGTNSHELNDGTGGVLKATHCINRTVLEPELQALKDAQRVEGSNAPKVNLDVLIRYKPELVKSEYNKLTEEERQWVDQCLDIKPGSPQMEVTIPKKAKPA